MKDGMNGCAQEIEGISRSLPRYPSPVNDWQSRCLPDRKSQQGAAHLSCG